MICRVQDFVLHNNFGPFLQKLAPRPAPQIFDKKSEISFVLLRDCKNRRIFCFLCFDALKYAYMQFQKN